MASHFQTSTISLCQSNMRQASFVYSTNSPSLLFLLCSVRKHLRISESGKHVVTTPLAVVHRSFGLRSCGVGRGTISRGRGTEGSRHTLARA